MHIDYPLHLPITSVLDTLRAAIQRYQVVIVAGETGSGKSSQLPKLLLERTLSSPTGGEGPSLIMHTQPRRIAAKSIASRLAEELRVELGTAVGYQVRFSNQVHAGTRLVVATDGILLSQMTSDPLLKRYAAILLDEVHERSLNMDCLLGYLKRILDRRPDLKIILSSATLESEALHAFWGPDVSTMVSVAGRAYPVEVLYKEPEHGNHQDILQVIEQLWSWESGDVLVFLPTEKDILEIQTFLKKSWATTRADSDQISILPLYARLNHQAQTEVFNVHRTPGRRIILSTNVAETSLTIPGIKYVIDLGTARVARYNARVRIQRLPIEKISQAAANQRKGRCGRLENGVCIRLYSQADFEKRPAFNTPEILRSNLSALCLKLIALGVEVLEDFPFITQPQPQLLKGAVHQLFELGAIVPLENHQQEGAWRLTDLGHRLMRFPLDPSLGAMLLNSLQHDCLEEVLCIVAYLSAGDVREKTSHAPHAKLEKALLQSVFLLDKASDFISIVNLWHLISKQKTILSRKKFKVWGEEHQLSIQKIREWEQVHAELKTLLSESGIVVRKSQSLDQMEDRIHRSLLVGLLAGIGLKVRKESVKPFNQRGQYTGIRNRSFCLFHNSKPFKSQPDCIMSFGLFDLVETGKVHARYAAKIELKWILNAFKHLIQFVQAEPYWDEEKAGVYALQEAQLHGLSLYRNKKIFLASWDLPLARTIFIQQVLLNLDLLSTLNFQIYAPDTNYFLMEYREKLQAIENATQKIREDSAFKMEALYELLDGQLPKKVHDFKSLDGVLQSTEAFDGAALLSHPIFNAFSKDDVDLYPETLQYKNWTFPVDYLFKPGDVADGAMVSIPAAFHKQIQSDFWEWSMPAGFLLEKISILLKHLPPSKKINLKAEAIQSLFKTLKSVQSHQNSVRLSGGFNEAFKEALFKECDLLVTGDFFSKIQWPAHLILTINWLDDRGQSVKITKKPWVDTGTDLTALNAGSVAIEQKILYKDFPKSIAVCQTALIGGHCVTVYGHLDCNPTVHAFTIATTLDQQEAAASHRFALIQLIWTLFHPEFQTAARKFPGFQKVALGLGTFIELNALMQDLFLASIQSLLPDDQHLPYEKVDFDSLIKGLKSKIIHSASHLFDNLKSIEMVYGSFKLNLKNLEQRSSIQKAAYQSIVSQLNELVHPGFMQASQEQGMTDFFRIPYYFQGIKYRLQKLEINPQQAQTLHATIEPLIHQFNRIKSKLAPADKQKIFFLLEELRLSLFAPMIKMKQPVSVKKLGNLLNEYTCLISESNPTAKH